MLGLITIVSGICLFTLIALYLAKTENLAILSDTWSSYNISLDGEVKQHEKGYIVQFWTPSKRTKENSNVAEWEKISDDENILQKFGDKLWQNNDVFGYRRYEIFGRGRTTKKWGYWWIVTVDKDYKISELMETYKEHFHNTKSIYIEVLGNSGTYQ